MSVTITIEPDTDASSPREWDNLGTMSCRAHRRQTFGDEQFPGSLEDFVKKLPKGSLVLPMYLYDHSVQAISTKPFSCSWDSSALGVIWVSPAKLRAEYGRKLTEETLTRARAVLEAEVETYHQYVNGQVYGYSVTRDGEHDSCWGYYGSDVFGNGMAENFSNEELPALLQAAAAAGLSGTPAQATALAQARAAHVQSQLEAQTKKPSKASRPPRQPRL